MANKLPRTFNAEQLRRLAWFQRKFETGDFDFVAYHMALYELYEPELSTF